MTAPGAGLFERLLGDRFALLAEQVRLVHSGPSLRLRGTGTIVRGTSVAARLACALAGLPANQANGSLQVEIVRQGTVECWTRCFGESAPMQSMLSARDGFLVEQLGLVTLWFELQLRDAGIDWSLQRVRLWQLPLPSRLFRVSTWSGAASGHYRFQVTASLAGVGEIIRYEGQLQIVAG